MQPTKVVVSWATAICIVLAGKFYDLYIIHNESWKNSLLLKFRFTQVVIKKYGFPNLILNTKHEGKSNAAQ